ncbi:MAG: class I SAM-dependent methyltransferase [Planctomycetes bacterium]|nr:class I SAM-dependent methyltransferase [Planctomycetota bacterium]
MTRRALFHIALAALALSLAAAVPSLAAEPRGDRDRDAWQQPDRVVADLGLADGAVVADVGCGSGYFTFRLAKAVGLTGKVYAEDIAEKALAALKARVDREGVTNVEVVKGEATSTHLPEAAMDAAVIVDVIHHVPKEQRPGLMADVVRAVKPGGFVYLVDWRADAKIKHDLDRRIPRDDLLETMTGAGLVLDAEYHYLEHQVFFRFRKPAKP